MMQENNMNPRITVAIVTRNRASHLTDCLASLVRQKTKPPGVLVVNNNSVDTTSEVVRSFSRSLAIREVIEKNLGYPNVYNRALRECTSTWVAFIDDDCIATPQWFNQAAQAVCRHATDAAILGASQNFYSNNVFATAFQFSNAWWRLRSIKRGGVCDYRVLDSRNILYNLRLLRSHGVHFDSRFNVGAEDSDLGLQIQQKGLTASYAATMVVYHKEPHSLSQYVKKKASYARSARALASKWGQIKTPGTEEAKIYGIAKSFRVATKEMTVTKKILCFFVVVSDLVISKCHLYDYLSAVI